MLGENPPPVEGEPSASPGSRNNWTDFLKNLALRQPNKHGRKDLVKITAVLCAHNSFVHDVGVERSVSRFGESITFG